ncbi:MAG TPA: XdhC family protein [Steroidobacteraceae bacterium]|nr:XdhC family protein [Steroidobacteraceae bacterium]
MEALLEPLLPLFERERAAGRALVLGVLVRTDGSTYRKPGALMVIAASGEYVGLLSGGCLEGDLRGHAQRVLADGSAGLVRYDLRSPDDLLWGLGIGCEGEMQILLLRCGPDNGWQPLAQLAAALGARAPAAIGLVVESADPALPRGSLAWPAAARPEDPPPALAAPALQAALAQALHDRRTAWYEDGALRVFVLPLALPPRLLILGAGPDAVPVAEFAARLHWQVTLADHRPAYAVAAHFPGAARVVLVAPDALAATLDLAQFDAAVIMSHHLLSDLAYLRALAPARVGYIGLLGPAARRDKLLAELGASAATIRPRLRAPVGLRLGGRAPESVALAIVGELHQYLHGVPD